MIIKCAWNGEFIGTRPPFGGKYDKEVIDGICDECLVKYFPNVAERAKALDVTQKDGYQGGT